MRTRWKILIGIGVFLALAIASAWLTAHHQPQNAVEDYKQFLRAHGEKLTVDELLPPRPSPESNSLAAVQNAFALFVSGSENIPYAMKMVSPGRAMVGHMQPLACGYDFTNSWDDFSVDVAANLPAIEILYEVLERPKLDFQLEYKKGSTLLLPHLAQLKKATQKLDAAAICQLHNGEPGLATTNILIMLALVHRNADEGLVISHLVRIAMASIAVAPTWELLQSTNVSDAQLAAVQRGWSELDFISDATNVFALERAWGINEIQKMRASRTELFAMTAASGSRVSSGSILDWPPDWEALTEKPRYAVGEMMWRTSWSYTDELRTLKSEQIVLETLRRMQANRSQFYKPDCDLMVKQLSSLGITNAGEAIFHALKIPDLADIFGDQWIANTVVKTVRLEAAKSVIVTAIALKRFQLKHSRWPEVLDELSPEFLSGVPIDFYDGKPLKYHPNTDGTYLLYCVGEDGVDNGGSPTTPLEIKGMFWQYQRARDWVWPQPATDAEIKFFYEHPPK